MASFLVAFGTGEGQTAAVADRIVDALSDRGHDARAVDVAADSLQAATVEDADAVVVGASIHVGTHQPEVVEFVATHREALRAKPTAFFQVSLSSATDDPERRAGAAGYVDDFLEETGWEPDRVALFGGALRYSKYGFLKRLVMKRIARVATGDVDTARDYEYTDWAAVRAFADDFGTFAEGRIGTVPGGDEGGPDER